MTARWPDAAQAAFPAAPTLLLTPEEAAAELRIARRRLFDLIREGTLPSVKIGRSRRIRRQDLHEYVAGLGRDAA